MCQNPKSFFCGRRDSFDNPTYCYTCGQNTDNVYSEYKVPIGKRSTTTVHTCTENCDGILQSMLEISGVRGFYDKMYTYVQTNGGYEDDTVYHVWCICKIPIFNRFMGQLLICVSGVQVTTRRRILRWVSLNELATYRENELDTYTDSLV